MIYVIERMKRFVPLPREQFEGFEGSLSTDRRIRQARPLHGLGHNT